MGRPTPYRFFNPNHRRAQLAVIGLGVAALSSVIAMVALLDATRLVGADFSQRVLRVDIPYFTQQLENITAFQLVVYLVTGFLYLLWIHQAYQNHAALYPQYANYSTEWAVWGFIIPIINFFRPYQVVDEMWGAAHGSIDPPPPERPSRASRKIVLAWWITFLAPLFLTGLAGGWSLRTFNATNATPLFIALLSQGLLVIAAVLAIHITQTLDLKHEEIARRVSPLTAWADLPRWQPWLYLISLAITVAAAAFIWKEKPPLPPLEKIAAPPTPIPTLRPSVYNTLDPTHIVRLTATKPPTATPTPRPTMNAAARQGMQDYEQGNFRRALMEFNEAVRLNPNDARIYYYRALTHQALDDTAKALKDFDQAIKLDAKYVAAYVDRGWVHIDDNNYGKAQADFNRAIALDDEDAPAYAGRGYTHYLLEDHRPALADANTAIDLAEDYAQGFFVRGLVYHAVGEFEKALTDFSATLDLDDQWAEAYYRRGLSYVALEDNAAARADFDRAIELQPDYIAPYFDRGILFYDLAQYSAALDDLNRVVQEIPAEGAAYFWRGAIHAKLGNNEQAIADLEKMLELSIEADIRRAAEDLLKELKGERRPTS